MPFRENLRLTQNFRSQIQALLNQGFKLQPGSWRTNILRFRGRRLARTPRQLYDHVMHSKSVGVPFLGHGSWLAFLESEFNVSPTALSYQKNERRTDGLVHVQIGRALQLADGLQAKKWQTNPRIIPEIGRSLRQLYYDAGFRKGANGRRFFGYGTWLDYLHEYHGVQPAQHSLGPNDERPWELTRHQIEQAAVLVGQVDERRWRNDRRKIPIIGRSLRDLYDSAKVRKGPQGNVFHDCGSWDEYVRVHHPELLDGFFRRDLAERGFALAKSIARKLTRKGVDPAEAESAAMLGLHKAVQGFDPSRKVEFEAFATPVIQGEILSENRKPRGQFGKIPVGRSVLDAKKAHDAAAYDLEQEHGRKPTQDELAVALDLALPQLEYLQKKTGVPVQVSIDTHPFDEAESRRGKNKREIANPSIWTPSRHQLAQLSAIEYALSDRNYLSQREKRLFLDHYVRGLTQIEISEQTGLHSTTVQSVIKSAREKIRQIARHFSSID